VKLYPSVDRPKHRGGTEEIMMRAVAKAQVRPAPQDFRRNPLMCVLTTASIAVTFWFGMVWLAERIMS